MSRGQQVVTAVRCLEASGSPGRDGGCAGRGATAASLWGPAWGPERLASLPANRGSWGVSVSEARWGAQGWCCGCQGPPPCINRRCPGNRGLGGGASLPRGPQPDLRATPVAIVPPSCGGVLS